MLEVLLLKDRRVLTGPSDVSLIFGPKVVDPVEV